MFVKGGSIMDEVQINQLRKSGKVLFKVIDWVEKLTPIAVHDDFGTMYKGCILAKDEFGIYTAIVGTTDQLVSSSPGSASQELIYKVLKVSDNISNIILLHENLQVAADCNIIQKADLR